MFDVTELGATEPTPEEVARWEAAVEVVRAEHPDWSDEYIAGAIAYAVMTPEVVQAVEEIAAQHDIDVENWTAVIRDLQERFPEWSEQECNDNLINLLRYANAGIGGVLPPAGPPADPPPGDDGPPLGGIGSPGLGSR